jgi:hypothetical protein
MSSDEIAKLHQLFKDGALTEQEYEAQKRTVLGGANTAKKKWPMWARLSIAAIGIVVGVSGLMGIKNGSSKDVPKCEHPDARALMQNAIEKNATANAATLRLLDLTDTKELSYSDEKKERRCNGVAFLNSGRIGVNYRMWLTSNGSLLIEVNETAVEAPRPSAATPTQPSAQQSVSAASPPKTENLLLKGGWDRARNASTAVSAFISRQQKDGVAGVVDEVQKCHAQLPRTADPQKVEYCIALDIQARNYYQVVEKANGWPLHEFWDEDTFLDRLYPLLDAIGVPPPEQMAALVSIDQSTKRAAKEWAEARTRK